MRQKITIRSSLAAVMLLIFAFSTTPQIILHSLFSHHQHRQVFSDGVHKVISRAGPICNVDTVFNTTPFTAPSSGIKPVAPVSFIHQPSFLPGDYQFSASRCTQLRGPPSRV